MNSTSTVLNLLLKLWAKDILSNGTGPVCYPDKTGSSSVATAASDQVKDVW